MVPRKRAASVGVDGCRGGWFYFAHYGDEFLFGVERTVADILARYTIRCLLIDMPIGLSDADGPPRECDRLARQLLGPRRASVFSPPIRSVLSVADYHSANTRSRELSGRGLSRQTFNIMPRIAELDALMRADHAARKVIREAHPEVCFRGLAGGPMAHSKRTTPGFDERLAVLSQFWPQTSAAVREALAEFPRAVLARDDVLDALALAIVAARPKAQLRSLPGTPVQDRCGLPMQMIYWPASTSSSSAPGAP